MNIRNEIIKFVNEAEEKLKEQFTDIENNEYVNSLKVLKAFKEEGVSESFFAGSTGYGYNDYGRDKIERIFARILGAQDVLVRSQIISGTHALTTALFAVLRPGDTMLSISGLVYDTLHEVIGIKENSSSLNSFGINYEQIDLINDDFDYDKIKEILNNKKYKVVYIQRSKGYSTRKSLDIEKLEKVIKFVKDIQRDVVIMVDNCYTEFVETKTPLEVGADLIVGSLIKNLGGGIASNGGYIAGQKDLVALAGERLTVPGEGKEVGPSNHANKEILMGLYHAPSAVAASLKTAVLTSYVLEKMGYEVEPKYNDYRCDIVQNIVFGNSIDLVNYVRGIQSASAVDSNALPEPTDMPGYDDKIIMASGSFTQGSSIEISCDGPIRPPYIAYQQGALSYSYGKIALMVAASNLLK